MDRKLDSIDEIISRYRDVINDNEKSLEEYKDVTDKYEEGMLQGWIEALEYAIKELEEHHSCNICH